MNILVLEPYYGGSHQAFLAGLTAHLPFSFTLLSLPARKWKWRMRLAAPYFADLLQQGEGLDPAAFDCLFCSTFVDVAALKGLLPPAWRRLPLLTYFHENQMVYPVRVQEERDVHFALTNLTTALASDALAFNSAYNLDSFLAGCRELLKIADDMKCPDLETKIRGKATIIYPGQDFAVLDAIPRPAAAKTPVIVWNHRWEHDKNPESFFQALYQLDHDKINFKLIVLGASFAGKSEVFQEAEQRLASHLLHFGYTESRRQYLDLLRQGDLVLSTSRHEFFGISVIEAVRAGCRPLLPSRLSYPELFPPEFHYQDEELVPRLKRELSKGKLPAPRSKELTERFSWKTLAPDYEKWFRQVHS